jgi:hypothetical protein
LAYAVLDAAAQSYAEVVLMLFGRLDELDEHAAGVLGMNEVDP